MTIGPAARGRAFLFQLGNFGCEALLFGWRGRKGGLDDVGATVQGFFGRGFIERLSGEAFLVDEGIGGDDDGIGAGNLFVSEKILGANRALGFNFDLIAKRLGGFFQSFGRHEGVSDAGRAGGDADDEFLFATAYGFGGIVP